jgi:hypothetical protein
MRKKRNAMSIQLWSARRDHCFLDKDLDVNVRQAWQEAGQWKVQVNDKRYSVKDLKDATRPCAACDAQPLEARGLPPHLSGARHAGRWSRRTPKGLALTLSHHTATLQLCCGDEPIESRATHVSGGHTHECNLAKTKRPYAAAGSPSAAERGQREAKLRAISSARSRSAALGRRDRDGELLPARGTLPPSDAR